MRAPFFFALEESTPLRNCPRVHGFTVAEQGVDDDELLTPAKIRSVAMKSSADEKRIAPRPLE